MPSVHIKGLKELFKAFERFDKEMHKELKDTLKSTIREVARDAKAAAPEDSGEYKRSIAWRISKSGLVGWAYASRKKMTDGAEVSNRGYIGHLLEYGTRHSKARPHFTPALDRARAKFGGELEKAIRRIRGVRSIV